MRNTQSAFRLYDHVTVEVTRDRDNRDSETQLANNILSWDASLNYGHPDIKAKRVGDDLIDEFRTHVTAVNPDGSIQIANNPHTAFDGVTGAHPRFTNVRIKHDDNTFSYSPRTGLHINVYQRATEASNGYYHATRKFVVPAADGRLEWEVQRLDEHGNIDLAHEPTMIDTFIVFQQGLEVPEDQHTLPAYQAPEHTMIVTEVYRPTTDTLGVTYNLHSDAVVITDTHGDVLKEIPVRNTWSTGHLNMVEIYHDPYLPNLVDALTSAGIIEVSPTSDWTKQQNRRDGRETPVTAYLTLEP